MRAMKDLVGALAHLCYRRGGGRALSLSGFIGPPPAEKVRTRVERDLTRRSTFRHQLELSGNHGSQSLGYQSPTPTLAME